MTHAISDDVRLVRASSRITRTTRQEAAQSPGDTTHDRPPTGGAVGF